MKRTLLVAAVAALVLAGCGEEPRRPADEVTGVTDRVSNEQALRLVGSCRVSVVATSHSGEAYLHLRSGEDVFVADPEITALIDAAEDARKGGCDVETAVE